MAAAWAAVIVAIAALIADRWITGRRDARQAGERDGRLLQVLDELRRIGADHEARIRADHDALLELQRGRR